MRIGLVSRRLLCPSLFAVVFAIHCLAIHCLSAELDARENGNAHDEKIDQLRWEDVPGDQIISICDQLSAYTKANYEKIRTWKGTYKLHVRHYMDPGFVNERFKARSTPERKVNDLYQTSDGSFSFAIDTKSDSIYRDSSVGTMRFHEPGSGAVVKIPNTLPVEGHSVVTSEHYINFPSNQTGATYTMLPDHPEAQRKRAAYVRSRALALGTEYGDLPDPRGLFGLEPTTKFWSKLDSMSQALSGKFGEQTKSDFMRAVKVAKATVGEVVYYRHQIQLTEPGGEILWTTWIWSSEAGFNAVRLVDTQKEPGGRVVSLKEWKWMKDGSVYVPAEVFEQLFDKNSVRLDYERRWSREKSVVNGPLDRHQFDYQGLGMRDGDLVLNDIEQKVYKIKGGGLVKLGNYGDHYIAKSGSRSWTGGKWLLIIGNAGVLLLLLVLLPRAMRRSRGSNK